MVRRAVLSFVLILAGCESERTGPSRKNLPPVARIQGLPVATEGSRMSLDGRPSSDPDGDYLAYLWLLPRGVTAEGPRPSLSWADDGLYPVRLIVTDYYGASDTARIDVAISNAPPVIRGAYIPEEQPVRSPMEFVVWATDPGEFDQVLVTVRWGDGTMDTAYTKPTSEKWGVTDQATFYHAFQNLGSYEVRMSARDQDGGEVSGWSQTVSVYDPSVNRPPEAFVYGAYGSEGIALPLSGYAEDPEGGPVTFAWHVEGAVVEDLVGPGPYVLFRDDGEYVITLTVTDIQGATAIATARAVVWNLNPEILGVQTSGTQVVGVESWLSLTTFDRGTDTLTATIDWGDGTTTTASAGTLFKHTYATPGSKLVGIRVYDEDGGSVTTSRNIEILKPAGP